MSHRGTVAELRAVDYLGYFLSSQSEEEVASTNCPDAAEFAEVAERRAPAFGQHFVRHCFLMAAAPESRSSRHPSSWRRSRLLASQQGRYRCDELLAKEMYICSTEIFPRGGEGQGGGAGQPHTPRLIARVTCAIVTSWRPSPRRRFAVVSSPFSEGAWGRGHYGPSPGGKKLRFAQGEAHFPCRCNGEADGRTSLARSTSVEFCGRTMK